MNIDRGAVCIRVGKGSPSPFWLVMVVKSICTHNTHRSNTPLSEVFQNDFWGQRLSDPESHKSFRPLTTLSFRMNHVLHGLWPPGFHLINLLSHSFVSSLLCLLCLRLKLSVPAFLACSLLFASHPIHTEAVSSYLEGGISHL